MELVGLGFIIPIFALPKPPFNHYSMSRNIYFTPGPSELYFTVEDHIKQALKEQFPSQSHRGNSFKKSFRSTIENLRELLNVPSNYHILFKQKS